MTQEHCMINPKQAPTLSTLLIGTLFSCALPLGHAPAVSARPPAPVCDDLVWSAQVLAANPDIRESCRGVYVRNDTLYARVIIQLSRVRGDQLTFRTQLLDGTLGEPRSIRVDSRWRANIDGRKYRASELQPGQVLSIYVPEDRFALTIDHGAPKDDEALPDIAPVEP
jgi:hypothetical protein